MANIAYYATSLTGGGAGALDGLVDGDELADLDGAVVITLNYALFYLLDADSGAAESSPIVIAPDLNPGTKRWILTGISEISAAAMKQLKNIGATTISADQWAILGALTTDPIIKAWIQFNGTNVIAIQDSFNVSSIVDNGVGNYTVNWDTDFANDDYSAVGSCGGGNLICAIGDYAVGSIVVVTYDPHNATSADRQDICVIAIGDQ